MSDSQPDAHPCVEILTDYEHGATVEEVVAVADCSAISSYSKPDEDQAAIRVWVRDGADADAVCDSVRRLLERSADVLESAVRSVSVVSVRSEDWAETWKRHFRTRRVSRRIVIKPSWEEFEAGDGDVVLELDPGMSFGTGQHETTRVCLQLMDELADRMAPCSFLDAGCGSGVLSMAAIRLGFRPVVAFDNDLQAEQMTRENLAASRVDGGVEIRHADLACFRPDGPFALVAANILAPILVENAARFRSLVATGPDSRLILSGILDTQYDEVRDRFAAVGFEEVSAVHAGQWTSGCFRRIAAPSVRMPTALV